MKPRRGTKEATKSALIRPPLLLLILLLGGCGTSPDRLLGEADTCWRKGDYRNAIQLNRRVYRMDREEGLAPQALLNIGNIYYLNLRSLNEAVDAYEKLAAEFPESPQAYTGRRQLAEIYANEIGDLTQAIVEYDKILQQTGLEDRAEIQFKRGNAYFQKGDYDRALREYRRLEESGVGGHLADQIHLKIGNVYQIRKRWEDAVEPFHKVLNSPCLECRRRAILNLVETYEHLYDFDRAIETVKLLDGTGETEARIRSEVQRLSEKRRRVDSGSLPGWAARK